MAISFDPQTNGTTGNSGGSTVQDDNTTAADPVVSNDQVQNVEPKKNVEQPIDEVKPESKVEVSDPVNNSEAPISLDLSSLDVSPETKVDEEKVESPSEEPVVEKDALSLDLSDIKIPETPPVVESTKTISIESVENKVTEETTQENPTQNVNLNMAEKEPAIEIPVNTESTAEIKLDQISLSNEEKTENNNIAEEQKSTTLNVNDVKTEGAVVPEAQNSIQTQKDEGVEKISNVESPQIESNSVEKNVVENKVGIENAVLENKLSEKKELESPVENTIPKVETETQEVNSAVVEEKKDDESVNKDIEMKLPNNWGEKKDDSWLNKDTGEPNLKAEESSLEKKDEKSESDEGLVMPDISDTEEKQESISVPTENPVVNPSMDNNVDKSGLDLTAISAAKMQGTENVATNVEPSAASSNTATSQGFDLDSMITQMNQQNTAASVGVNPVVSQNIPQNNVAIESPQAEQVATNNNGVNMLENPVQLPNNNVGNPVVENLVGMQQNQVQTSAIRPHKKHNVAKVVILVVLLFVLAGFLLHTMYPKEIKDLFNKLSFGNEPEMTDDTLFNNENVVDDQVMPEEIVDNNNVVEDVVDPVVDTGMIDDVVVADEIVVDTGVVEEDVVVETGNTNQDDDMENPFADLDELLEDLPGDPNEELINQLKNYQTQGEDFLELAELTDDATMIKYSTVLATIPVKDIKLIESGEFSVEEIESHIKRLDLYLEKLQELVGEEIPEEDPTAPLQVEEKEPSVSVDGLDMK